MVKNCNLSVREYVMQNREPTVKHTLDDKGREALSRPVKGKGGHQDFTKVLQKKFENTDTAAFNDKEWGKLNRYAENGRGGAQRKFSNIRGMEKK